MDREVGAVGKNVVVVERGIDVGGGVILLPNQRPSKARAISFLKCEGPILLLVSNAKTHLTIEQQVDLLGDRGMIIDDRRLAERALLNLNYYRFSGYAREFQDDPRAGRNQFVPGTTFSQVLELIDLDAELRLLMLEALTLIEVRARSALAYESGQLMGDKAFYLEASSYLDITPEIDRHLGKISTDLKRPKQPTVERYRNGEDLSQVPVWVAIEAMSFGTVAKMSWYLNNEDVSKRTASSLGLANSGFSSTLHTFSVLRNKCAHHSQLWNRTFDVLCHALPKEKKREPRHKSPGPYSTVIVAKRWLKAMLGENDWGDRVASLLAQNDEFREGILNPRTK